MKLSAPFQSILSRTDTAWNDGGILRPRGGGSHHFSSEDLPVRMHILWVEKKLPWYQNRVVILYRNDIFSGHELMDDAGHITDMDRFHFVSEIVVIDAGTAGGDTSTLFAAPLDGIEIR